MKLKVFIGPQKSGKDTAAKLYPGIAGKIPFAGPLKQICASVFGFDVAEFEDQGLKAQEIYREIETNDIYALINGMMQYLPVYHHTGLFEHLRQFEGKEFSSRREILQFVATEMVRAYDPDWHCKAAFSCFDDPDNDRTWAVTDCRFLNEYEYLKKNHDCKFFYVERPEAEAQLAIATHQSEREIIEVRARAEAENFLTIIRNDGNIQDLKDKLDHYWFYHDFD
jgi:hypothetical protein